MKFFLLLFSIPFFCFKAQAQTVTWSHDVAPILYANCTKCHNPGGAGHFPLLTFADAYTWGFSMETATADGTMPPWTPNENYKHFAHERVLPQADIDKISQWVTDGRQQGDITLAPAQPTYTNGSSLGSVDLSVKIPTYAIGANNDVYRNFPITTTIPAGSYITAVEVIPGNTHVVHHVLIFQDSTNTPAQLDANQSGPGYTNAGGTGSLASKLIAGWTPGASPYYTPVGTGFRLAANTNIVVQVHYPSGSQGLVDSTRINFKITSTPQREITVWPLLNHLQNITPSLSIPANQTKTFTESAGSGGSNFTFLSAFPHMHLIGRTIKSFATTTIPNDTIRFVDIPDWDFHWQDTYVFPNAVKVPSNSTLKAIATYDNTTNNPDNPSTPPQNVVAGEATTDEMMMVFFGYMPYVAGDENLIIDRRVLPQGATTFCNGQSVVLKTIEGVGYSYQWYRNGASISNATSFAYTATQGGNYHVKIFLGPNNSLSDTIALTVNSSPVANVTSGSTVICPGNSITLNATTGNGYNYQWFKNDTLIANATSASYLAGNAGNYKVQVYNGCYANSNALSLTTGLAPSSTVTPSGATAFCQGGSVILSAPAGLTYHWSNNATSQTIGVNQSGGYIVTVTNGNNCSAVSSSTTITVHSLPSATITPNGATTFCQGGSVTLSAPAGMTYHWSNNATTQTISTNQSGSYLVTVTNGNNCSAVSTSTTVTVNSLPTASISANGATSFCPGSSVILIANNATTYHWSNNSTVQSITVSQAGNYLVTITDANNCSNSASVNIVVYTSPDATVTTNQPTTICPGDSVVLSAVAGMSYLWSTNAVTQSITVSTNGNFIVTVADNHSCTATSSAITVTISNSTVAGITPTGATTFCEGGSVQLTASNGSAYQWSNSATSQSITVNASGSFTVTVTEAGSCTAVSVPVDVVVNSLPVVTLSGNVDQVCSSASSFTLTSQSPAGGTFSGTGIIGSLFDPAIVGAGNQTVTYTYTDNNGCINTATETIEVITCTGINEADAYSFTVSPNPNNGSFELQWNSRQTANAQLNVFDISGKLVYSIIIEKDKTQIALDKILSGCYLLQLKTNGTTVHRKLLVQF